MKILILLLSMLLWRCSAATTTTIPTTTTTTPTRKPRMKNVCLYLNDNVKYQTLKVEKDMMQFMLDNGATKGKCDPEEVEIGSLGDFAKKTKQACLKVESETLLRGKIRKVKKTIETQRVVRNWLVKHDAEKGMCPPNRRNVAAPVSKMTIRSTPSPTTTTTTEGTEIPTSKSGKSGAI